MLLLFVHKAFEEDQGLRWALDVWFTMFLSLQVYLKESVCAHLKHLFWQSCISF